MSLKETLNSHGFALIKEKIGGGGSATVHQAKVISDRNGIEEGTELAVKEYSSSIIGVSGQIERIRQEAKVGAILQHNNLVKTYILIEPNSNEDGQYFLILEWIDGETLDKWYAKQQQPVEWLTIKSICQDIVNGVRELHKNGVFHRDLKPENIMVRQDGSAVVMDIGVAELTGNDEHTLHTSVKDFVGSVRFASPQFIMGKNFTQADDVYSIGATIFLLFTGKTIFHEIIRKPVLPIEIVTNSPKIEELRDNIPAPMKIFLQGCLHKDPKRRPTLDEISECLDDPENASYITSELERQSTESRSYLVIDVLDNGYSCFADLAGDSPQVGDKFIIVRRGVAVNVPSYDRVVIPEQFVAKAVLKHINQNVAHFRVIEEKWVESSNTSSSFLYQFQRQGYYDTFEKVKDIIKKGDFVLKDNL